MLVVAVVTALLVLFARDLDLNGTDGAIVAGSLAGCGLMSLLMAEQVRRWQARNRMDLLVSDLGVWRVRFEYFVGERRG
jgi:hypothetical protein